MLKYIVLLLFIVVVCCIVYELNIRTTIGVIGCTIIRGNTNTSVMGGANTLSHAIIEPNSTIVIDGHNMIHQLQNDQSFSDNLRYLSEIISDALPNYNIHIVIKNPNDAILTKHLNKPKQTKANMLKAYFEQLVELSKDFPTITYHLAQGNEPKTNRNHYLKGRDDFLSIYLAKGQYVVSQDRYKDFSSFVNIKPFYHLSVKAGTVFKKTKIDPKAYFTRINKPNLGSHLTYQFITDQHAKTIGVKSGDIIVEKPGVLTKLYLVKK